MCLLLETDRLLLRPFEEGDLPAFVAYRSDLKVARYQSWNTPYTMEQAKAFLTAVQTVRVGEPDGWYQVVIALRSTGEMIGDCAFCILEESPRQAEIGYTLAPAHQGKGYAREAVERLLTYLFVELGLERVRANCDVENHRSAHLLRRLRMEPDGPEDRVWFKGRLSTEQWYALGREGWEEQGSGEV